MGSGHFPVFALPILARMRMEEEGGTPQENIHGVLKDQIHGLELDQRCCQIGAFNLALTAWKLAGLQQLPPLNVACCGIAPRAKLDDWVKLATGDDNLKAGMAGLHKQFEQAPILGSLINPTSTGMDLLTASYKELRPLLERALLYESRDEVSHEMSVAANGIARAAEILAGEFFLVATNVPYLGRSKQEDVLKDYSTKHYPHTKADLATTFLERCVDFCQYERGSVALVSPQNWLFLGSYLELRKDLLSNCSWNLVSRLGPKGFQTPMWDFNTALVTFTRAKPIAGNSFVGLDVAAFKTATCKALALPCAEVRLVKQQDQLGNPDAKISFSGVNSLPLLSMYADSFQGIITGDGARFRAFMWEIQHAGEEWISYQSTVDSSGHFGGMDSMLRWGDNGNQLARRQGLGAWNRSGVMVSQMGKLPVALYGGTSFDSNASPIVPKNPSHLPAIWCFCSSPEFNLAVRSIDQKLSVTNATLVKVPFDLDYWQKEVTKKYPNGLPAPFSSDPTQWLFSGHPHKSDNSLQVAVARLLCYQWPRQTGSSFPDCPALGPDGLEKHADDDGIVALSPINREEAAAARLRALLKEAYAAEWQDGVTERQLLADAGHGAATLEEWLRDSFFEEHCKLFDHRPFIWHIWDGEKDGFHVLVNYHRLAAGNGDGTRLLQKLATTYLGDWIARCSQEVAADKPGAARRLKAAQDLQVDLRKILEGEAPNDIFVRWKPLREQAIGWSPDINDGVRLNIRPFLAVRDVGKKGAGLLRVKPNVKWDKDRGKEPQRPKSDFPWFWSCDPESNPQHATDFTGGATFTGERWNNLHYTLAVKKAARNKTSLT
jgi:hypothetical protein